MSKMIEQLEEMKTLQFEHEFQNYRDEYDDELAIRHKSALIVSLGQVMNCFSSKWTERSGDAGTITDNRSEAFTWYIMSLYHVLSLFSYRKQKIRDYLHEYQNIYYVGDLNDMMTSAIQFSSDEHGLTSILAIGKELGFEWNDIYYRFMTTYQV